MTCWQEPPQEPPEDIKNKQLADRDRAIRVALTAADDCVMVLPPEETTRSEMIRVAITAAIGYLIGLDLIEVRPQSDFPEWIRIGSAAIPAHLRPER